MTCRFDTSILYALAFLPCFLASPAIDYSAHIPITTPFQYEVDTAGRGYEVDTAGTELLGTRSILLVRSCLVQDRYGWYGTELLDNGAACLIQLIESWYGATWDEVDTSWYGAAWY